MSPLRPLLAALALCLLALAAVPSAEAAVAAPDLNPCDSGQAGATIVVGRLCVSVYWPGCNVWIEWTAIPSPDTCLYRTDGLQSSAAGPSADCYPVYSRTNVGPYSVVRRSSCAPPEFYVCPYQGAPISECEGLLGVRASSASLGPDSTPDVQCMDVYSATQVPGTGYWIVRRDSCSLQLYECPAGSSPPAAPCQEVPLFSTSTTSAAAALPSVEAPPVYCMPYEREVVDVGSVRVVQGGCGSYAETCGERVGLDGADLSCILSSVATSSAQQEPDCLQVYRETDLGLVRIVSPDSCHTYHYLCDQEKADILADGFDADRCDTGLAITSAQPLPTVPDLTQRTCFTQGQGELQSRTCIDPESTDCTVYRQQITGVGSSWVCYPSGESGSDY